MIKIVIMLARLIFLILKLMGIKQLFSESPIDYKKLRKTDKKHPPKWSYRNFQVVNTTIKESEITKVARKKTGDTQKLVLFVPGGAFISGPVPHHWDVIGQIVKKTNVPVWMVDYLKAPESDIRQINENIDKIYKTALQEVSPDQLILIGDSVGGTLIMSLVQRLIAKKENVPSKLILITPVCDASMTNEAIAAIDKVDPMLSRKGILSAKEMCAQGLDLKHPSISPLYGAFEGFPSTLLFLGGKDIMYPDGILTAEKMKDANVPLEVIDEIAMPHVYPVLPMMRESQEAMTKIVGLVRG